MHVAPRPALLLAAIAGLAALAACDRSSSATAPWPTALSAQRPGLAEFNPQPDPPAVIAFTIFGDPAQSMRGTFTDPACARAGSLAVTSTYPAVQRGVTLHVSQSWVLVAPGPCRALGNLLLQGIVNGASGQVVLNGQSAAGNPVQVRGTLTSSGGVTQIVGRITVEDPNERGVEDPNQ